jgi:hypothetical protein
MTVRYKLSYLTGEGKRIAEQIRQEGDAGKMPQSMKIA